MCLTGFQPGCKCFDCAETFFCFCGEIASHKCTVSSTGYACDNCCIAEQFKTTGGANAPFKGWHVDHDSPSGVKKYPTLTFIDHIPGEFERLSTPLSERETLK